MGSSVDIDGDWTSMLSWHSIALALVVVVATTALLLHEKDNATKNGSTKRKRHFNQTAENQHNSQTKNESDDIIIPEMIPFIILHEPSWRVLSVTLEKYRRESSDLLKGLSQSLELALHSEREMGMWPEDDAVRHEWLFSDRLQHRIQRVSDCLDHNENQLHRMLQQFPVRLALPSTNVEEETDDTDNNRTTIHNDRRLHHHQSEWSVSKTTRLFTMKQSFAGSNADPMKNNAAYDCGAQIIAHIVRDWTTLGEPVRRNIYDWCRSQIEHYVPKSSSQAPILVPGSGLGRLAFDIAFISGYTVEANEISLSMAAVAHAILQNKTTGSVHPFALDFFANEVEAERRYDIVRFPDVEVVKRQQAGNASLSYTVGEFVEVYRWQRPRGSFAAVVTCFFIDTATNLYEYLATIEHLLAPGGIWVNIGPLRWHANSLLHPSVDELRAILESPLFGFKIIKWSVDTNTSEYRSEENEVRSDGSRFVRSTAYESYRPLRFVATRRG